MEIFNNYYAKISLHFAKNIRMTFWYFDTFLYKTFSFIFGLGFDFASDSCASKGK